MGLQQLILMTCIVCFQSTCVKPHHKIADHAVTSPVKDESKVLENIQNLFDSIAKNNTKRSAIYHEVLEQEEARERQAYDTMKEEIQIALNRNRPTYKKQNFHQKNDVIENKETKRETNDNDGTSSTTTSSVDFGAFFDAAKRNDLDAIKSFVEKDKIPLDTVNFFDETCAHIAAKKGYLNLMKYVLEKDPGISNARDTFGNNLLSLAVQNGHFHLVKYLVENQNADILKPFKRFFGHPNAVHLAAESGQLTILKYFVEEKKANVNATSVSRLPLAFSAARRKHFKIVKYLLEERNADLTMTDSNGDNILYTTIKESDLPLMKYLLDEKKVDLDVNYRNKYGRALLHLAAFFNNVNILSYLVEEKGADVNIADNKGQTPLHRAAHYNHFLSCNYLVEQGADINFKDHSGKSPIEEAKNETLISHMTNVSHSRNRRSVPSSFSWIEQ